MEVSGQLRDMAVVLLVPSVLPITRHTIERRPDFCCSLPVYSFFVSNRRHCLSVEECYKSEH